VTNLKEIPEMKKNSLSFFPVKDIYSRISKISMLFRDQKTFLNLNQYKQRKPNQNKTFNYCYYWGIVFH